MNLQEYLKKNYSETSVRCYLNLINRFKLALGSKADQATYTDILNYIGLLREERLHPKSLRNNLFSIKIYFSYLIETGKRDDHPCKYLQLKDKINRGIQIEGLYSKETLEELYNNYQAKNPNNQQRDKIIVSLLVYQALTVFEICSLKISDVYLEEGVIRITKGSRVRKTRALNLKSNQVLLFHNYLKHDRRKYQRNSNPIKHQDYFLPGEEGSRLWEGATNRIINHNRDKSNKLIPIKIRQSVITNLLKENNDIRIIQEFAGHRRTASTEAYKQTGLDELKGAISKYHPLQ